MNKKNQEKTISQEELIQIINTYPIYKLMPTAKRICGTDYAVRFYYNKKHQKYYLNKEAFRKALRRCITINAFGHSQQLIDDLDLGNI